MGADVYLKVAGETIILRWRQGKGNNSKGVYLDRGRGAADPCKRMSQRRRERSYKIRSCVSNAWREGSEGQLARDRKNADKKDLSVWVTTSNEEERQEEGSSTATDPAGGKNLGSGRGVEQ